MPQVNDRDTAMQAFLNAYLASYAGGSKTDYEDAVGAVFVSAIVRARHDFETAYGLSEKDAARLTNDIYRNQLPVLDSQPQPDDPRTN